MAREYRILEAIHPHFPEAPQVFHLCEDQSVIGAVFFLMECRHGLVLRDSIPPENANIPDHPARISEAFIQLPCSPSRHRRRANRTCGPGQAGRISGTSSRRLG